VSIGILAHNEESRISATLRSAFVQDVFKRFTTELIIVANGCSDRTAFLATRMLNQHPPTLSTSARVEEIAVAGKANAWNQFVHHFSSRQASFLVLMDADIALTSEDTISSMVSTLDTTPEAVVCVDQPLKDIQIKTKRSLFERVLVATTPTINPNDVPLCGQIYCVRSAEARLIKLPIEITCEDGFLRALLLTRGFTAPENLRRIVLDRNASHTFESVAKLRELFKHERWLVAGSIINMLLFERFSAEASANRSAMTLMDDWGKENLQWLPRYIESEVRSRGWRLLPRAWWTRRWSRLNALPLSEKLFRVPIAAGAAFIDAIVFVAAIRDVRRGHAYRYWDRVGQSAPIHRLVE
jgi:hypothetical protein